MGGCGKHEGTIFDRGMEFFACLCVRRCVFVSVCGCVGVCVGVCNSNNDNNKNNNTYSCFLETNNHEKKLNEINKHPYPYINKLRQY